jgi:hypothetical protein
MHILLYDSYDYAILHVYLYTYNTALIYTTLLSTDTMPSYRALALGKAFAHWQVQPHFQAGDAVYSDTIREGQLPAALHCGRPLTLVQTAQVAYTSFCYVTVVLIVVTTNVCCS